jgi:SAM-dependent methyltransferase
MKLRTADVEKLESFLNYIGHDIYPEAVSDLHLSITTRMIGDVLMGYPLPAGATVLDVGCGQGLALSQFAARGLDARGITLGVDDVNACVGLGLDVVEMDQSFLDFADASFDLVWCRHCLEHSIFPYYTLNELKRVLKPAGLLYVEVPAPDTACAHQTNPNHYSVLGKSMWHQLMSRSGFDILDELDISFATPLGPDSYWAFVLRSAGALA